MSDSDQAVVVEEESDDMQGLVLSSIDMTTGSFTDYTEKRANKSKLNATAGLTFIEIKDTPETSYTDYSLKWLNKSRGKARQRRQGPALQVGELGASPGITSGSNPPVVGSCVEEGSSSISIIEFHDALDQPGAGTSVLLHAQNDSSSNLQYDSAVDASFTPQCNSSMLDVQSAPGAGLAAVKNDGAGFQSQSVRDVREERDGVHEMAKLAASAGSPSDGAGDLNDTLPIPSTPMGVIFTDEMAEALWYNFRANPKSAVFELRLSTDLSYAVFTGIKKVLADLTQFQLSNANIRTIENFFDERVPEGFGAQLKGLQGLQLDVDALNEGEVVFSGGLVAQLEGPLLLLNLIEKAMVDQLTSSCYISSVVAQLSRVINAQTDPSSLRPSTPLVFLQPDSLPNPNVRRMAIGGLTHTTESDHAERFHIQHFDYSAMTELVPDVWQSNKSYQAVLLAINKQLCVRATDAQEVIQSRIAKLFSQRKPLIFDKGWSLKATLSILASMVETDVIRKPPNLIFGIDQVDEYNGLLIHVKHFCPKGCYQLIRSIKVHLRLEKFSFEVLNLLHDIEVASVLLTPSFFSTAEQVILQCEMHCVSVDGVPSRQKDEKGRSWYPGTKTMYRLLTNGACMLDLLCLKSESKEKFLCGAIDHERCVHACVYDRDGSCLEPNPDFVEPLMRPYIAKGKVAGPVPDQKDAMNRMKDRKWDPQTKLQDVNSRIYVSKALFDLRSEVQKVRMDTRGKR